MMAPDLPLANETLNALAAHIAVLDANGVVVFGNEAWCRFARTYGGTAGTACYIGTNYLAVCRDAVRSGDATAAEALSGIESVLRGEREQLSLEYPCPAPDRERWFRMSVTRTTSAAGAPLVVAHEEITAQKLGERALQQSERRLRAVLQALPVGVWIMDASGRIVEGNAAGQQIWGGARFVGPNEFGLYKGWWASTGQPILPDEWAAARAIRNGETSIDEEVEIECFDETHKIILNSAVPLFDDARRIIGAIIVNQDITARKRAEAEREGMLREQARLRLEAVKANQAKDEFIATLSHELRTPLQSVIGWAAILKRALPDADDAARAASAIERSAHLQAQLLNETLDLSRIGYGKLTLNQTDVNLASVAGEMVEAIRPAAVEKRVTLDEQTTPAPAMVRGDPVRLRQVLWNLLSNALKFTPAGGRIEVLTRADGEWVEVSVRDTGLGIPADLMPHLFERFRQGSDPEVHRLAGLGLGLAIAKELVTLHGGTIAAESPGQGQGAKFTIRLPHPRP